MPYYATENQISTQPIEGGIEITKQQYKDALQAQLDGHTVVIRGDGLRLLSPETRTVYSIADKSEKKIAENDDVPSGYTETEPQKHDAWDGAKWVEDTAAKQEAQWERIRSQRDQKLSETDYAVLPDSPHDTQAVRGYRQALRDLPQSVGNPDDVVWPDNPLSKNTLEQ